MKWDIVKLGDICKIVSGATPKTGNPAFWNGNVPWVTPKDLSGIEGKCINDTFRKITDAGFRSCSANILPPYSVLFSSRAPIGLVAINTVAVCTNQGFKSMLPQKDRVSPDYLYWWLKIHRESIEKMGRGATFKEVSKKIVEEIQIPLPPLAEQKRIAAVLDAADAMRTKRRETIALLDTLLQSTFIDMFGDPFDVDSEGKHVPFADLTERITYGFTCPMSHLESGVPILTAKNVLDGDLDMDRVHYADQQEFDALTEKSKPKPGDVLVTKDGSIGRCAIVPEGGPICINQSVALIILKRSIVTPEYVSSYIRSLPVQQRIQRMGKGNALKHLQITELAKFPAIIPPLDLQHRFVAIVESIEYQKALQRAHLDELDILFASLQQRGFNGELSA